MTDKTPKGIAAAAREITVLAVCNITAVGTADGMRNIACTDAWTAEAIEAIILKHYPDDKGVELLLEACKEFVRKVECGKALSKRSYPQMKAAIAEYEANK